MNNYKNQTTAPQQEILFVEPTLLSTNPLQWTQPELEIPYGELTPEQQAMVEQAAKDHLDLVLGEGKTWHAGESITRVMVHNGAIIVEAEFQCEMLEARAQGRRYQERINRSLNRRMERLDQHLTRLEDQHAARQTIVAGKSNYPKLKVNNGKLNFIFRLFTSEKTEIHQATEPDQPLPMATGTLFGNRID